MNVGEIGIIFVMIPTGLPNGSLAGSTVLMKVARTLMAPSVSYMMTISSDNSSASYSTTGDEFLYPGVYQIQFVVTYTSGAVLKSPIQSIEVDASLL